MSKKKLIRELAAVIVDCQVDTEGYDPEYHDHVQGLLQQASQLQGEPKASNRNAEMIEAIRQVNVNPVAP